MALMILKWFSIPADWELTLIFFGLAILFYLKRVMRKEDHHS
ncbi:hypothetical protein [Bacillus pumilus]|nr:hypothetical protein [Bacillus pumilus]